VSPLGAPPVDLGGFPVHPAGPDLDLYRIHLAARGPWWFSSSGDGRFDLSHGRGTCYLAGQPIGAFLEVFRASTVVPAAEVAVRRLSRLRPPHAVRLADCTVTEARAFGVTAAIHWTLDYELPRLWAEAFAAAGFDGVRYRVSHDPSQRELGIALFGPEGARELPVGATDEIGGELLEEARRRFGLVVAPIPD
jgi:RES domain